jgi:hypothetical protein
MAAEGHKTRRAALRALAGASALAIPTISAIADALSDPIFIAIERHRAAYKAREATSFALDDLMNNREVSDAEWDAYDRARATEEAAFDELLTRAPTTAGYWPARVLALTAKRLSLRKLQSRFASKT